MRSKILTLILISLSIVLVNCKGRNEGVQIYNPSNADLNVQLNDSSYTIEANSMLDLDLDAGEYEIQSFIGTDKIVDTVINLSSKVIREGVLLNVSGEKLYTLSEIYGAPSFTTLMNDIFYLEDSLLADMDDQLLIDAFVEEAFTYYGISNINRSSYNSVLVNNYILVGNIDIYEANQVVVLLDWDYAPGTPYPDEIEVEDNATNNAFGVHKSKLFNASDLIEYYLLTYSFDPADYDQFDEVDSYE
ncbi:MAG: hypothetical protein GQ574_15220 [Crocinitomix sp.]|nr:hypothetical protein [Crocinitomix sp.]